MAKHKRKGDPGEGRVTLAQALKSAVADRLLHLDGVSALARAAGVPQPVLHRFMKGERDLTLRTADKLARFLGMELRVVTGVDFARNLNKLTELRGSEQVNYVAKQASKSKPAQDQS